METTHLCDLLSILGFEDEIFFQQFGRAENVLVCAFVASIGRFVLRISSNLKMFDL